jgi:hypothetical protein
MGRGCENLYFNPFRDIGNKVSSQDENGGEDNGGWRVGERNNRLGGRVYE